jgi:hypothetical protein
MDVQVLDTTCAGDCSMKHEAVHLMHMQSCCQFYRLKYQSWPAASWQRNWIRMRWDLYERQIQTFTECQAYRESGRCLRAMYRSNSCDCPFLSGATERCCTVLRNRMTSNDRYERVYCVDRGGAAAHWTPCPAFDPSPGAPI